MISVERIVEYAELPSEPAMESDDKNAPPKNWPRFGSIEFKSLSLRYAENMQRVLKNLTFRIDAKVRAFCKMKQIHLLKVFVIKMFLHWIRSKKLESVDAPEQERLQLFKHYFDWPKMRVKF